MIPAHRLAAIESVAPCVRAALLTFTQNPRNAPAPSTATFKDPMQILGYKKLNRHKPLPAQSGIRIMKSSIGTRYRAHLVIKGLRLYTNTSSHSAAIDHHIIFVQMRDALAAASSKDPCIWTSPDRLLAILNSVLARSNTSETIFDLHVFVYMRGTPWLDKNTYIVSPAMQLDQAVPLYGKLLRAQCTSWEALRAEWVQLLQLKKTTKGLSQTEAEAVADHARQKALKFRFRQAEQITKWAMKRDEDKSRRARAAAELEQRRLVAADAKAKALERKVVKQRLQMWKARRQSRCKDMTMEDIMNSTKPHL